MNGKSPALSKFTIQVRFQTSHSSCGGRDAMAKRTRIFSLIALLFFASSLYRIPRVYAQWNNPFCGANPPYDAGWWPTVGVQMWSGGIMNGQACEMEHSVPNSFTWAIWGSTLTSQQSYWLWAYVEGFDSCNGFSLNPIWSYRMASPGGSAYLSTGTGSGPWTAGSYQNCGQSSGGHRYQVRTQHQRLHCWSGCPVEGYASAKTF